MSTKFDLAANADLLPGEVVLGNRIRMAIPARVRDELLPKSDDDLVDMVRKETKCVILGVKNAKLWIVALIHLHGHEWEGTEKELAWKRTIALFNSNN